MLFSLYAISDARVIKTYYTPLPQVDIGYWLALGQNIIWLSPPMALGKLVPLSEKFLSDLAKGRSFFSKINRFFGHSQVGQDIREIAVNIFGEVVPPAIGRQIVAPSLEEKEQVLNLLKGRVLFPEEIRRALLEQGISLSSPYLVILQSLYLERKLEIFPALLDSQNSRRCNRCGEKVKLLAAPCAACGDEQCYYCDNCNIMGQARGCQALFAVPGGAERVPKHVTLNLDFELTEPQQDAFRGVGQFALQEKALGVVWAACGAGKTEVSFGAIREVLAKGGRVLYAIPRKDVVIELEPRLRKAFPGISLIALYGGSGSKYLQGELVIATTHQCLRFYRNFDLVVLDEADAFPYDGSEMLYLAVERARAYEGKILYMSATPSDEMVAWLHNGRASGYTIPARYHGYPLPVPSMFIDENLNYSGKKTKTSLPQTVIDFIIKSVEGDKAQVFVFVPTVSSAQPTAEFLQEMFADKAYKISYSFARDPERERKRKDFSDGRTDIFVTTSIMERGITVTRANVLVLFADYKKIYSWRTLVQMAGRAGRTKEYPAGEVCFAAETKSEAMQEAVQAITRMNKEAAEKGYLNK